MPTDRTGGRDVLIYTANDRSNPQKAVLAGLILTRHITKNNFYTMIEILFNSSWYLQQEDGHELERDQSPLLAGFYYITGSFVITSQACQLRPHSSTSSASSCSKTFINAVRTRDQGCVMSGIGLLGARHGNFIMTQAAHIYPLSLFPSWDTHDFGISDINSVKNGLLLKADIHLLWGAYMVSIDVKDSYKIVGFGHEVDGVVRGYLDEEFLQHCDRPPDKVFEWHFEQCVLANMKGTGSSILEFDFPPGSDMLGEIREGPMAEEEMEMELFSRLADQSM